ALRGFQTERGSGGAVQRPELPLPPQAELASVRALGWPFLGWASLEQRGRDRCAASGLGRLNRSNQRRRQMIGSNHALGAHDGRALDRVAELAHVAGPVMQG